MKQSRKQSENLPLALNSNSNYTEGFLCRTELLCVVQSRDRKGVGSTLIEVVEVRGTFQTEFFTLSRRSSGEKLVEDVVISLGFRLVDQSRTFK